MYILPARNIKKLGAWAAFVARLRITDADFAYVPKELKRLFIRVPNPKRKPRVKPDIKPDPHAEPDTGPDIKPGPVFSRPPKVALDG